MKTATTLAAPGNQLSNANVTPGSGTTNTTFTFAVTYRSAQGNEPTSVSAVAGNVVIPLNLVSGTPSNGRYRGRAKLPQGSWSVSYLATARGNDPSLNGPTVTVTRGTQQGSAKLLSYAAPVLYSKVRPKSPRA